MDLGEPGGRSRKGNAWGRISPRVLIRTERWERRGRDDRARMDGSGKGGIAKQDNRKPIQEHENL